MLINSESFLKGGDDHTSEAASLYNLGNHTITNATLCPEMDGLDSQRGATLDAQKTCVLAFAVYLGGWSIASNSLPLVRHLPKVTFTKLQFIKIYLMYGNRTTCPGI